MPVWPIVPWKQRGFRPFFRELAHVFNVSRTNNPNLILTETETGPILTPAMTFLVIRRIRLGLLTLSDKAQENRQIGHGY